MKGEGGMGNGEWGVGNGEWWQDCVDSLRLRAVHGAADGRPGVSRPLRDRDTADLVDRLRFTLLFALAMTIPVTILIGLTLEVAVPIPLLILGAIAGLAALGWWCYPLLGAVSGGFLRLLIAQGGDPVMPGYSEQEALIATGRLSEAADSFRARLIAYPDDIEARIRLAALLVSRGEREEALEQYRLARGGRPSPPQRLAISTGLADLHRAAHDHDPLVAELSRCAREFPGTAAGEHARRELRTLVAAQLEAERAAPPRRTE